MQYTNVNYEISIDGKGRISVPAEYRKQLPEGATQFIIKKSLAMDCLELYPIEEWKKIEAKMSHFSILDPEDLMALSIFNEGANKIEMDSSGRLNIQNDLLKKANISENNTVLFASVNQMVCIWDKAAYEEFKRQNIENARRIMKEEFGRKKSLKYDKN